MKWLLLLLLGLFNSGCDDQDSVGAQAQAQAQAPQVSAGAAGLDLQALGELVKTSHNAQEVEQKLNAPGSINNLDLDGDGKVDYISVTEYQNGPNRCFSFLDDSKGEKQEVATIQLANVNNRGNMTIAGNQTVYGTGAYYSGNYALADILIWSYLFAPHPYYSSPYYYGYYPSYYHPYLHSSYADYHNRVSYVTRTTVINRTVVNNYNSGSPNAKYASSSYGRRASYSSPKPAYRASSSSNSYRPSGGSSRSYSSRSYGRR